jgi:hypothetical protein
MDSREGFMPGRRFEDSCNRFVARLINGGNHGRGSKGAARCWSRRERCVAQHNLNLF